MFAFARIRDKKNLCRESWARDASIFMLNMECFANATARKIRKAKREKVPIGHGVELDASSSPIAAFSVRLFKHFNWG